MFVSKTYSSMYLNMHRAKNSNTHSRTFEYISW